jgi:DNA-binding GntR family transcriptional regulator
MADNLSVSQTPVRGALARLEQEGPVEIVPPRGTYVGVGLPAFCSSLSRSA